MTKKLGVHEKNNLHQDIKCTFLLILIFLFVTHTCGQFRWQWIPSGRLRKLRSMLHRAALEICEDCITLYKDLLAEIVF